MHNLNGNIYIYIYIKHLLNLFWKCIFEVFGIELNSGRLHSSENLFSLMWKMKGVQRIRGGKLGNGLRDPDITRSLAHAYTDIAASVAKWVNLCIGLCSYGPKYLDSFSFHLPCFFFTPITQSVSKNEVYFPCKFQ
jgi:hypothetical protein